MTVTVINGKIDGFLGQDTIYIGRRNKYFSLLESPLANPYVLGIDGDREEILKKYKIWLWQEFKKKDKVYAEIIKISILVKAGHDIKLACWCAPKKCHGDIVKKLIEWVIKNLKI